MVSPLSRTRPRSPVALWAGAVFAVVAAGAAHAQAPSGPVSYTKDVRPILDRSCVACHACYDAPCQLKLDSAAGVERGASQAKVYQAARIKDAPTTRLFFDASDPRQWRQKGFVSVTDGGAAALMKKMLELGRAGGLKPNRRVPEHVVTGTLRNETCPRPGEMEQYAEDHPLEGMPLATPPLAEAEYQTLSRWLDEGAPVDSPSGELTPSEAEQLGRWESWLNRDDARGQLVSRYLYEHLFLGTLFLEAGDQARGFELVRSRTPPGQAVDVIATRRPNHDPGGPVYYRLRLRVGTPVHKTRITYAFDAARRRRFEEIFYGSDWTVRNLPDYSERSRANPFLAFRAIPARARYQFLIEDGTYFVRNFIRGPVCRGQIATDVIDDHFYAIFQDPDTDLFLSDPEYAAKATPGLALPESPDDRWGVKPEWLADQGDYMDLHVERYAEAGEAGWEQVWDGDGTHDDALLTIFRHFDSATVVKGLRGETGKTVWLMDYPILERIYYLLVVNFDVFGRATHQIRTRLYFDLLRVESEKNFLRLYPAGRRKAQWKDWYRGTFANLKRRALYGPLDDDTPGGLALPAGGEVAAFLTGLNARSTAAVRGPGDSLNRCGSDGCVGPAPSGDVAASEAVLRRLVGLQAKAAPFILHLPEITYLRVGENQAFALTRDKHHESVAFMMGEDKRLRPKLDRVTLHRGPVGSYPNFIFAVPAAELETFVDELLKIRNEKGFGRLVEAFGVRRTRPDFWEHFHFFSDYMRKHEPREWGIYDLNRYENF